MNRSFLFVFIIFLLSFFLTTQNCIAVSSDVIKFSDPVVESICVSNWDRNYDRKLSYSEAELVTDLENVFTSSSISYFNELQYFTGLESISFNAFSDCHELNELTLPNSIVKIEAYAFDGCTGLEDVVIGDGVMSIGDDAFMQCMYIKKLKIGKNIRKLGRQVFVDCASVDELELGSLVDIGAHALPKHIGHLVININVIEPYIIKNIMGAAQVSSVEIGENVSEIGDYAFKGYSLKKFKIGKNVKRIGEEAFFNCGNLGHIELPSNIQYIGPRAFGRTSGYLTIGCNLPDYDTFLDSPFNGAYLSSINIGNSVSKIGKYSLSSIGGTIKEISIGSNVKELGQFAFRSTKSMRLLIYCDLPDLESQSYGPFYKTTLDEIVFAQRVSRLGCNLFDYSGVKKIIIESNLNEIGSDTFKGFQGDLIIKSNVPDYYKPEDSPFYGLKVHSIEFGTWVNSIGENAFNNTSCQEQLKLLSTLTNIGERAFMGFDGTLYLNYNTLDSEKSSASPFYKSKFREVKVGNSVTKIGSYAFYDCVELKKVEIGKKVQVFGQEAFGGRTNLEQIYLHCDNPPILESDALGVNSTLQIYVPINSVKAYKKSWKKQRKYVVPINTSLSY